MTVRVVFLGPLRDLAGVSEQHVPAPLDWATLLAAVSPAVAERLRDERVVVACDGQVLGDKTALTAGEGCEIALLPPVSGG